MTALLLAAQLCVSVGWYQDGVRYYPKEYPRCNEIVATVEQAFKTEEDARYNEERQRDMKVYQDGLNELNKGE